MDCVKNNNFPILTETEHRLHLWHQKHNEYAFGADLRDISIKYWDLGMFEYNIIISCLLSILNYLNHHSRRK